MLNVRLIALKIALCLALGPFTTGQAYAQDDTPFTDNIVIILDASGSMEEPFTGNDSNPMTDTDITKMDAAKDALKTVLSTIPETTQIGLLVFSGFGYDDNWLHPLGPRDERKLLLGIFKPMPAGRTPLGSALKVGADRLLEARTNQHGYGSYRLLVVTDGEATDPEALARYAPDVVSRGLTLDLIGVGMQQDHSLRSLANSYRSADDPTALTEAVREIIAEVDFANSNNLTNDIFEVLDGLPDEFAMALLRGLEVRTNHPIGQRPPAPTATAEPAPTDGVQPSPTQGPQVDTGLSTESYDDEEDSDACCAISFFFFLWLVSRLLKNKRSRAGEIGLRERYEKRKRKKRR